MKLYDFAFSPNSRKVRAVAYELGIPLELVHVDLPRGASHTPSFLAINPNGRVPVLVDDGFVLWESSAILRYLSSQRGGALVPADARAQADMDRWMSWLLAHLAPAMRKVAFERIVKKLTGQGVPDEAAIAEGTAEFARLTAILDAALERRGREARDRRDVRDAGGARDREDRDDRDDRGYVAGPLSLADFALASHYSLAATSGLDLGPFAAVNAWLARVLRRDSMKRALADAHASTRSDAA